MQTPSKDYLLKGWKSNRKMKRGSLRIPLLVSITRRIKGKCTGRINESLRKPLSMINLSLRALMGSWDKRTGTTLEIE